MTSETVHLRRGGVSLVLTPSPRGVPVVLHWGGDLGELSRADLAGLADLRRPGIPQSALDDPRYLSLAPESASGFTGTPAVEGHRSGSGAAPWSGAVTPYWSGWETTLASDGLEARATDAEAGLALTVEVGLTPEGVVRMRTTLTNTAEGDYVVGAVRNVLPVSASATEVLDLTGRWCRERSPQRHPWLHGKIVRESRHGRPGHDATLLMVAGTPGFRFRSGRVWAVHVAWSGDHVAYAERTAEGECLLGGGERLEFGEVVLGEGETYTTPWVLAAYSDFGMDGISERLHRYARKQAPHPGARRPVVLNTWEASYMDHDVARLMTLADAAVELGVERYVLDDGWFRNRRSDQAGLGDWTVDTEVYPQGLHPLVDHVRNRGMEFGLWVEPEMVNADSELARAHPDWLLRGRSQPPGEWRHQQVLDLQHPEAFTHVRDALLALLDEYPISYLKWDHNRDVLDAVHDGRLAVHGQTRALYALLDELRAAHPDVEIESCASGGGRVDLEILTRTDRIWPSDTNDAVERQHIQRWTTLLVPPEMIGCHVGAPGAHTTGRTLPLAFRAATALLGHFGIEWDLTALTTDERSALAAWVRVHKQVRDVVSTGTVVRPDQPDPAVMVHGVVAPDRSRAVFVIAVVTSTTDQSPPPVLLDGLDAQRRYAVRSVNPADTAHHVLDLGTSWLDKGAVTVPGQVLMLSGLRLPATAPESAYVVELVDASQGSATA